MALETLFSTKEKFGNLKFVTQIRRDPELGREQQLYLVDEIAKPDGKRYVSFLQALGDTTKKNQIGCFTFLKQTIAPASYFVGFGGLGMVGCAVDERERLLYMMSGNADQLSLKLFHLLYQAADKFGYRRISVQEGRCVTVEHEFTHGPPPTTVVPPYIRTLSICPVTGQLASLYTTGARFMNCVQIVMPCEVSYNSEQQKAWVKTTVNSQLPVIVSHPSVKVDLPPAILSRSNHLLFWQGFHQYNIATCSSAIQPAPNDDGCVILRAFVLGHPENCHLSQIKIDSVQLVESLLPKYLFDYFLSLVPSDVQTRIFFGARLRLLGHVYKYVIFSFCRHYILAAKWPKEWYELTELPDARVRKVLCVDKEKTGGKINDICLMAADLYIKSQLGDAQVVRRMALGHKFKDYRRCAFCGKEETGKRKKDGKRVSDFKVCRICKEHNFHLFYGDASLACHYCSHECVCKDWKRHKIIHQKEAKDRK